MAPAAAAVGEAAVAAFSAELGKPIQPPAAATPPPVAEAAAPAPAVTENGDPPGPSLDDLMGPGQAAAAPAAEPQPTADAGEPAGAPLSEISIPTGEGPPIAPAMADATPSNRPDRPGSGDVESIATRRRKRSAARRRIPSLRSGRMPALILVLVGGIAALIAWRGSIVRHAPQMASLYARIGLPVNLRGLAFTEVRVSRDTHDGVAVLMVEGSIASAASTPVEVPRLRFAMRNETGAEIYAWTAMPTREVLGPAKRYRSAAASPRRPAKAAT